MKIEWFASDKESSNIQGVDIFVTSFRYNERNIKIDVDILFIKL